MRRLGLSIALAVALGLLLMQTAPGIRDWFNPVRTVASDQLATTARPGMLSRITGSGAKTARIAELEREVRELRQANDILRKASAYFAQAELDRRSKT